MRIQPVYSWRVSKGVLHIGARWDDADRHFDFEARVVRGADPIAAIQVLNASIQHAQRLRKAPKENKCL